MADSVIGSSSANQILSNYQKYKDYFTDEKNDSLGQDDFLSLMVEQMKNQDFTNPTDNSEYIAQMAQFSSVQQIQQMTYYTNATYATSLVGKTVVIGKTEDSGDVFKDAGVVSSVKMNGNDFDIIVNGRTYQTKNIMEVLASSVSNSIKEDDKTE